MSGAVDVLKSWGIPIGEKQSIELPDGECSIDGLRHINSYIGRWCYQQQKNGLRIDLPNPANLAKENSDWKKLKDSRNRTWVKRYADHVRDLSGIKLGTGFLGNLGDAVSHGFSSSGRTQYLFDFTDVCDWTPSEFGENENSCWWSDFDSLRRSFFEGGGGCAIRFYNPQTLSGAGRSMLYGTPDGHLFFFNFYEKNGDNNMARLRALLEVCFEHLGVDDLEIEGCNFSSNIYINNNALECFRSSSSTSPYEEYDMQIEQIYLCCHLCGEIYHKENIHEFEKSGENQYICHECFSDDLIQCNCGRYGREDDMRWVDFYQEFFCQRCFHTHLSSCKMCDGHYKKDDLNIIGYKRDGKRFTGTMDICKSCFKDSQHLQRIFQRIVEREFSRSDGSLKVLEFILLDGEQLSTLPMREWHGEILSTIFAGKKMSIDISDIRATTTSSANVDVNVTTSTDVEIPF